MTSRESIYFFFLFWVIGGCTLQSQSVRIDGSSTVFPISQVAAELYHRSHPEARISVGFSGTGGGFKKFIAGETVINNASRPIKEGEARKLEESGIRFIELPVALDGVTVVVHPENDWVDSLTVEELRALWEPGSQVKTWSQIRPHWPQRPILLFAPGVDSGTFDYFTEAINHKSGAARYDFTASEDDNVLVQGIEGERDSLGFFGFAYYQENSQRLRAVPIINPQGDPVLPSDQTIADGSYAPLARPLFIYIREDSAKRPDVAPFVTFYLENGTEIATKVGYTGLPEIACQRALVRFQASQSGSIFLEGQSFDEVFLR